MQSWWTIRIITRPGIRLEGGNHADAQSTHPGRIIKQAIEAIPMSVTGFAEHIGVSRVTLSRV